MQTLYSESNQCLGSAESENDYHLMSCFFFLMVTKYQLYKVGCFICIISTSPTIGLSEKDFRPSWNLGEILFTLSTIFLSLHISICKMHEKNCNQGQKIISIYHCSFRGRMKHTCRAWVLQLRRRRIQGAQSRWIHDWKNLN